MLILENCVPRSLDSLTLDEEAINTFTQCAITGYSVSALWSAPPGCSQRQDNDLGASLVLSDVARLL